MRISTFAIAIVMACAASPAPAQDVAQPNPSPRYSFNRVEDGFLRLDNATGQVTICSQRSVGWACQAVPEDRAALEKEIARLQDAVAALKTEVANLRAPPPPPRPPADLAPPPVKNGDAVIKLPTHEDIEHARAIVERAWRSLVDMIVGLKNDVMRKG